MINLLIAVQAVFNVGIILLVVVSYHYLFEKIREEGQVDAVLRVEEVKKLKADMESLVNQMGRGASDSVERLEAVLVQADGRIKELKKLEERVETRSGELRELLNKVAVLNHAALKDAKKPFSKVLGTPRGSTGEASPFERVYLLADEMDDINEIARRCQLSQGEVEMILNLRNR